MYQFFVQEEQFSGDKITILGNDVNHIKNVLRMKQGTVVRVSIKTQEAYAPEDEKAFVIGRSFFGTLETITDEEVIVQITEEDMAGTELSNRIYLFQGLPKGDKMDYIVQKAVELGVSSVIPVAGARCIVKLDEKNAQKKVARWQKSALMK